MTTGPQLEVALWIDPDQVPRCRQLLELLRGRIRPIVVGGPRCGEIDSLARELGCPHDDDLRKLINDHPAAFLLFASAQSMEAHQLHQALEQETTVMWLEPPVDGPSELADVAALTQPGTWVRRVHRIVQLAAFCHGEGWRHAANPHEALGRVRSASFVSHSRHDQGMLLGHLIDAWMTLLHFAGIPDSIDASLVSPLAEMPRQSRGITGHLQALARFSDGQLATITVSDRAFVNQRQLFLIGEEGQIQVSDKGYALRNTAGNVVDHHDSRGKSSERLRMMAEEWQRLSDPIGAIDMDVPAERFSQALACAQACVLSCRTGHPESPARLLTLR